MASVWHQFSLDHCRHLSAASNWIGVQTGVHGLYSRTPHTPVVSKTSEADIWLSCYDHHLTDVGGLSTSLTGKESVLSTQQERSLKWIDPSEWWWIGEWWTSRESLWLPAIGTWGYPIRTLKWLGEKSVMFPICKAPRPNFSISEEFLHSTILRPKKPLCSWNLVSPFLRINEAWTDEYAARLQPLAD